MHNSDDCPHRPPCPGCPRFGEETIPETARAKLEQLAAKAGLSSQWPVHRAPGQGHRHRARLAVRGKAHSPKIGLFQAGSHRIADTPRCPVHHPLINAAAKTLREAIRETGIVPYADRPHRGALRYAQFVIERPTNRVQIVLVGNGESPEVLGALPAQLIEQLGDTLQALFFSPQSERSNAILGPSIEHLYGEPNTREILGGVEVFFPPAAFGQNHLPLFEKAIERIHQLVPPHKKIAEFYCGVGAIGLGLLADAQEVRFNERSQQGLDGLEAGLAKRPDSEREKARLFVGGAGERVDALGGVDSVDPIDIAIVDPPRKGLDPALCEALATRPPERLIYLACGLNRLLEDADRLQASGNLRLAGIEVFDFFPFTEHVETLAWFDATP